MTTQHHRERPDRGHLDRSALSRERVLAAAVAVADAEGLAKVTMRRVGEELDREAMTLYHYVEDKRSLLAGMAEQVIGEIVAALPAEPSSQWREDVRRHCLRAREVMLRHPWAPGLIAAQTEAAPVVSALFEWLVGRLHGAGFDDHLAHRAIHALGSMLLGFTQELFEPAGGEPEVELSPELLAELAQATPHLARMAAAISHEAAGSLSVCDTQAEFEFTLGLLLDGLERARAGAA